ncbi:hypothetical protein JCM8547_000132 [Rhodosporidiobolus lusitaniae]
MSSPAPSFLYPRLPFDVLRLVAQEAGRSSGNDGERRAAGRALSLVCRDLRDDGQRLVWQTLVLPSLSLSSFFHDAPEQDKERLLTHVRRLRWDSQRRGALTTGKKHIKQYWRDKSVVLFGQVVAEGRCLREVELFCFPAEHLERMCSLLVASPSAPRLEALVMRGSIPFPRDGRTFAEQALFPLLRQLPALLSFDFSSRTRCLVAPTPASSPPPAPSLRLRTVTLDLDHWCGIENSEDGFSFPSLRYDLAVAIDPSFLASATLSRTWGGDAWLKWIGSSAFTALTTLDIRNSHCNFSTALPIVPSTLRNLPHLVRFAFRQVPIHHHGIGLTDKRERAAFHTFLLALPPSLNFLLLDITCPIYDILEDNHSRQGADEIDSYLGSGSARNLQTLRCRTWRKELCYTLRWNEEEQRFDELSDPLEMSSPAPSRASPRLPYDVLRLVVQAAGRTSENDGERRAAERALSLLCRDLRDDGQRLVWQTLALPNLSAEDVLRGRRGERLAAMVRLLRWEEEEGEEDEWFPLGEPRLSQSVEVFLAVLRHSAVLDTLELTCLPFSHAEKVLEAIPTSPSSGRIEHFHFRGLLGEPGEPSRLTEAGINTILRSLTSLTSLSFHPDFRLSPSLADHTLSRASLPLRHLNVDTLCDDYVPASFGPASPLDRGGPWIEWLSRPGFSSLKHLTVHVNWRNTHDPLPSLSPVFTHHPGLVSLVVRSHICTPIPRFPEETATVLAFLFSLPPALEFLALLFFCPTRDELGDYLVNGPSKSLRYFQCAAGEGGEYFHALRWNDETEQFDEVSIHDRLID